MINLILSAKILDFNQVLIGKESLNSYEAVIQKNAKI